MAILQIVLAVFLPPVAVYLHEGPHGGSCSAYRSLTLLGHLPGVVYALYVVTQD